MELTLHVIIKSNVGFSIAYLNLNLAYSNGQLGSWNGVYQTFWPTCRHTLLERTSYE